MSKVETAEEIVAEANALFVDEDYDAALIKFNEAIELEDKNSDFFSKRSFCHFKLDNFTAAMADAKKAVQLDPKNPRAHFRKGMAAFSLEEYESAKEAFEKAQQLAPSSLHKTWIRKCEAELADEKDVAEESSDDMDLVKPQKGNSGAPVVDGPPPLEPDIDVPKTIPQTKAQPPSQPKVAPSTTQTQTQTQTQPQSQPQSQPKPQPQPQPSQQSKVRYEWFQTETHVTVSIFIKNVKKEDAKINIKQASIEVTVLLPTGSEYQLSLDLSDKVIPEETQTTILGTKIEIKLKKSKSAKWPSLEYTGSQVRSWDVVADEKKEKGLSYPSSSKHGSKDWDALAKAEPEDKLEGDAALNKVFADIYKGASDDQRRAMLKSFQESGGTVLSTNWDEVGKGEVKGSPPKGMEMKQWKDIQF